MTGMLYLYHCKFVTQTHYVFVANCCCFCYYILHVFTQQRGKRMFSPNAQRPLPVACHYTIDHFILECPYHLWSEDCIWLVCCRYLQNLQIPSTHFYLKYHSNNSLDASYFPAKFKHPTTTWFNLVVFFSLTS